MHSDIPFSFLLRVVGLSYARFCEYFDRRPRSATQELKTRLQPKLNGRDPSGLLGVCTSHGPEACLQHIL